ncbi:Dynein heavy chain, related [Eimeria brunetti]|uniref:Dynein heavy chain, related n=1 Tax=Eimeria brunetti TaxID=51314 RepID=U6LY51_9EIME|nr:Dynein heavy chain, related [Eimeria brunetti]
MVKPDFTLIAEVLMLANGFITASELATKVVQVFSIASALLTQQTHYDWGLRAMKAVLVNAGEMKKRQPGLDESSAMMHALQSIVPRLVMDDVSAYLGIVADMFPQQTVPRASDDPLKLAFEEILREQHLQPLPSFVEKAMQLYQTQQLRHGVLVRVRDALASQSTAHSWLVLDGPLDPNWAENLNSALDDNKILCLSNGERILLPSNLKIFFEVAVGVD